MKDSWSECLLEGETSLITKGTTPTSLGKPFTDSGVNFIKAESITNAGKFIEEAFAYIDLETHEILRRSQLQVGDILFSIAGVLGRVAVVNESVIPANTNQALAIIRLSSHSKIDENFIRFFLNGSFIKDQVRRINVQAAQANFSLGDICRLIIQYPPLPQQRKIASILSTCDEVIEKTEAAIAKYQALKQGMMHDLFTRGIDLKTGKLRPTYQDAPELYKESELGMIPKEWEVKELGELTNKIVDGTHFTPNYTESGVPFLRVTDVQTDSIDFDRIKFVSEREHLELIKRCNPERNDILYSKNGTIGIPKLVDWDWEFSIFVSLALIKPKQNLIRSEYLLLLLPEEVIWSQIRQRAKQGTVTNLHLEEIREFLIPLPGKAEQELIYQRGREINSKIQTEQSALSKYKQLKAGLMQDLLTAKVEVSVEEEMELKND